jgi:hypothetical protein
MSAKPRDTGSNISVDNSKSNCFEYQPENQQYVPKLLIVFRIITTEIPEREKEKMTACSYILRNNSLHILQNQR